MPSRACRAAGDREALGAGAVAVSACARTHAPVGTHRRVRSSQTPYGRTEGPWVTHGWRQWPGCPGLGVLVPCPGRQSHVTAYMEAAASCQSHSVFQACHTVASTPLGAPGRRPVRILSAASEAGRGELRGNVTFEHWGRSPQSMGSPQCTGVAHRACVHVESSPFWDRCCGFPGATVGQARPQVPPGDDGGRGSYTQGTSHFHAIRTFQTLSEFLCQMW